MDKIAESENSSIVIAGGWGAFLNIRIITNKKIAEFFTLRNFILTNLNKGNGLFALPSIIIAYQ